MLVPSIISGKYCWLFRVLASPELITDSGGWVNEIHRKSLIFFGTISDPSAAMQLYYKDCHRARCWSCHWLEHKCALWKQVWEPGHIPLTKWFEWLWEGSGGYLYGLWELCWEYLQSNSAHRWQRLLPKMVCGNYQGQRGDLFNALMAAQGWWSQPPIHSEEQMSLHIALDFIQSPNENSYQCDNQDEEGKVWNHLKPRLQH